MSAADSHSAFWRGFLSAFRDAKAVLTLNWKEITRGEW